MGTVWLIRLLAFLLLCCVSGCRPSRNQAETVCMPDSFLTTAANMFLPDTSVVHPPVNAMTGGDDVLGITVYPAYTVFSVSAAKATFILYNGSSQSVICGEHYSITYEDEKGVWRTLPIHDAFVDIGYVVPPGGTRLFEAGLYPDLHSNRAGRYRFFYDIILDDTRQGVKMMAEFRLSDDEEELKNRTRNTHQELPLSSGPNASAEVKYTLSADYVYECVEEMPEFPGGLSALLGFVKEHLRYPESARKDGLQGRVVVGVVIDEEGNVTQSCIFRSISSQLDAEALRVIGLLPKWKPGRLRGKPVKVRFAIPVTFKL